MRRLLLRITLAAGGAVSAWGQAGGGPDTIRQGAILFRQECVFCHGVGGRGGARAPDLTTGSWTHGGSDADLTRTITEGVPGTAMGGHSLTPDEVRPIIAYLRTRQQPAAAAPGGDARHGETLFFGAAKCSSCHMVNGRGGRLGPELSHAGSARPRAYLVESIRDPSRQLSEGNGGPYDTVTAVTRDGKTIVGVPMNEDTFTVQLMDTNERIHSLEKKSLKSFRRESQSLMPAYSAAALNDGDLQDVVAYLQSLRAATPAKGESHEGR